MGYIKNAIAKVHDEGCLWLEDSIIRNLKDAGLKPKTKHLVIEGFAGPVELDALTAEEASSLSASSTAVRLSSSRRIMPLLEEWG